MEKGVFVRRSSGLVKSFSPADAFMWNCLTVGILPGAIYAISTAIYAFPAANLILGITLTGIWGVFVWMVYACLASAMPRTGADYVYESRILNPAIGFIFPMGAFVFWCLYMIIYCSMSWAIYGMSPFLASLALYSNKPELLNIAGWFLSPDGTILSATILVFLSTIQLILPLKYYTRVQWFLMGSAMVSIIIVIIALLSVNNAIFIQNFNAWTQKFGASGDYYHYIIDTARDKGLNPSLRNSWYDTLGVLPATWFLLAWAFWSAIPASEVKSAENLKKQILMVPGSGVFTAIIWIIMAAVTINTCGQEFYRALTFLSFNFPELLITSIPPYTSFLASIARPELDLIISSIVMVGFFCSAYQMVFNTIFVPVRYLLAGSLDRILPDMFSEVHPRFHTPVKSIIFCIIVTAAILAAWRFIPAIGGAAIVAAGSFAQQAPLFFTCLAGAVFPFRQKTKMVYEASPLVRLKIGKLPIITVCGVIGMGLIATVVYFWATVPELGVANPGALLYVTGVYAAFAIYYFSAKAYRKRQGIDITKAYIEVPPT